MTFHRVASEISTFHRFPTKRGALSPSVVQVDDAMVFFVHVED